MDKRDKQLDANLREMALVRMAVEGNAEAQYQLWMMYCKDMSEMQMSAQQAFAWLQAAADQGHAKANFYLGELYESPKSPVANELGLLCDADKAQAYFKKAAEKFEQDASHDDAEAYLFLSAMSNAGMGVNRDVGRSRSLLKKAAELGNKIAIERLKGAGVDGMTILKKALFGCVILFLVPLCVYALPSVVNVTAKQRYPWNGLVDIIVTIWGSAEDLSVTECSFAATNSATKAAIPVEHITRNGDDTGSGTTWTRKFIWDAKADVGAVKIDDVALTVDVERSLGGVQLWENGPYWAECNVGATKPEEAGYYFWWGDTIGYKRNASNNGWISVKDSTSYSFSGCPTYGKNNSQLQSEGYIDATGNLVAAHDAATAHFGAPWRMPTDAEFAALISNCTTTWTTRNGVPGLLVTGKGTYASKSIFLPAAGSGYVSGLYNLGSYGYYWSSTPYSDYSYNAWDLYFNSGSFYRNYGSRRFDGQSVRPVRGFASASGGGVASDNAVTTHFAYVPPADDVTRFEGGLYGIENSPQDCEDPHGDERYIEHMYSEEDYAGCWQKDYVEIDGRKEPAAFRDNRRFGFAIPVLVASGGTITPEIVHLTSNGTYFHQIEVLSDEEFRTWDRREGVSIPSPDPNRCWVIVLHNEQPNVKPDSNQRYRFDITKMSAANGKDMMEWTHEHGEEFPEAISLPESVSYAIRIKETGEVFPNRFWNVYNPMYDELYDAFDGDDYEEEDYIECPGLWLVTQEMIDEQKGAGVAEVTFDANGGTCSTTSKSYESGAMLGTLPSATRSGYTFDGWFTAASGGTKVTASTVVTGDMTLYAHWMIESVAMGAALNNSDLSFVSGGSADWVGQVLVSHDGVSAAQSGLVGNYQQSSFQTTVSGAGTISFWWKVSSESNYDKLHFYVDGVDATAAISGETSWAQVSLALGSGSHTLKWEYAKDGSLANGSDCGWVDQVAWTQIKTYTVVFNANGGTGVMEPLMCEPGRVYKLPKCGFAKPEGKTRFAGWAGSNGRRYDDEMLVFNLAPIGGSVTLKAIWDPADEGDELGGVQLWENGPYWAECNVGATKPEECGYYFWWGDTIGYKRNANNDGWISVKDSTVFSFIEFNCPTYDIRNSPLQSMGYIDATGNLVAAHDAATAHLGARWRMPTNAEFDALINNCDTEWTSCNGVPGRLFKGRGAYASKSIFFPAAGFGGGSGLDYLSSSGYYWSSTPNLDVGAENAWHLRVFSNNFLSFREFRYIGQPVRPVRGFAE